MTIRSLVVAAALLAVITPVPARAYVEAPVTDGGALVGRVRVAGEPVKGEPIPVRKNTDVCGDTKPFQALVVGPSKGVRNTVVHLEGVERGKKPANFELDNSKCLFVPHHAGSHRAGEGRSNPRLRVEITDCGRLPP